MSGTTESTAVRITGYGVLSAAGVGGKALYEAVRSGALPLGDDGAQALDGQPAPPGVRLLPVPDFEPREHLGRKGLRALSRTTTLGMVAAELALAGLPEPGRPGERADTGVVLGTSTGSARAFAEFFRESYVAERPYLVSPALFPGLLLNHGASQVAMRHSFTGLNASLAGGQISALSALRYARNALLTGRAARLLTGGVEELSAHTAWAWQRGGALGERPALGEGSAVFVMETADDGTGRAPGGSLAELAACEVAFTPLDEGPHAVAAALARCVEDALRAGGAEPGDIGVVSAGASSGPGWSAVEARGRRRALAGHEPEVLRVQDVLGETYSASGALQLAALLAHWEDGAPAAAGGAADWGLVTSVGHDGSVGAALLRRSSATG
ncbi:beta-ketoacyl synthase N-terminal-like domain-containing protein [Streptomyces rubradiris]|uniref:3-oxoacyl-ACP synthase n=1 Tax=Streptomyces rubradiris TaxID=285531 RepID=A0ABQ3RQV4_STRRR|nr:beta-ketoacyl synthase N-terminal-like domain-containing protein [Streptomyces rubradiris]GHH24844.1 3-oxoacyl-ACP synthase [Streptomyces rubradiris]GHI58224.1 3-oxoacyl-ACP synthase [Streptomyces rubradiris]